MAHSSPEKWANTSFCWKGNYSAFLAASWPDQKTCQRRGVWMAPSNPLWWEKGMGKLRRSGKGSITPTWSAPGWDHLSTAIHRPAFGPGAHVDIMGQRGRYSNVTADAGSTKVSGFTVAGHTGWRGLFYHLSATSGPLVLLHKEILEATHKEDLEECNAKPCFLPEESRLSFPLWPQDTDYHWWNDAHAPKLWAHLISGPSNTSTSCYKYFEKFLET